MSYLDRILEKKKQEIGEKKRRADLTALLDRAHSAPPAVSLIGALRGSIGFAVIAEIKKASPSAGILRQQFNPAAYARSYADGGACAISVLTDETFFQGSLEDLQRVRAAVPLPVLRKDFVLDRLQLLEARASGADAVLLIVAALSEGQLGDLSAEAGELGLEVLIEVHAEKEMDVVAELRAPLVGINNRDLQTFRTDLSTSVRLRPLAPAGSIVVSESGIRTTDDLRLLARHGIHAALIGEHFMRAPEPGAALRRLLAGMEPNGTGSR